MSWCRSPRPPHADSQTRTDTRAPALRHSKSAQGEPLLWQHVLAPLVLAHGRSSKWPDGAPPAPGAGTPPPARPPLPPNTPPLSSPVPELWPRYLAERRPATPAAPLASAEYRLPRYPFAVPIHPFRVHTALVAPSARQNRRLPRPSRAPNRFHSTAGPCNSPRPPDPLLLGCPRRVAPLPPPPPLLPSSPRTARLPPLTNSLPRLDTASDPQGLRLAGSPGGASSRPSPSSPGLVLPRQGRARLGRCYSPGGPLVLRPALAA